MRSTSPSLSSSHPLSGSERPDSPPPRDSLSTPMLDGYSSDGRPSAAGSAASRAPMSLTLMTDALDPMVAAHNSLISPRGPLYERARDASLTLASAGLLPRSSSVKDTLRWACGLGAILEIAGLTAELPDEPKLSDFVRVTQQHFLRKSGDGTDRWQTPANNASLERVYPLATQVRLNLVQAERALAKMRSALPSWDAASVRGATAIVIHGGFGKDLQERVGIAAGLLRRMARPCYYLTNPRPFFLNDSHERAMAAQTLAPQLNLDAAHVEAVLAQVQQEHGAALNSTLNDRVTALKAAKAPMLEQVLANAEARRQYVTYAREKTQQQLGLHAWPYRGYADQLDSRHDFVEWPVPYDYIVSRLAAAGVPFANRLLHYTTCVPQAGADRFIANTADSVYAWLAAGVAEQLPPSSASEPVVFVSSGALTQRQHVIAERIIHGRFTVCTVAPPVHEEASYDLLLRQFSVLKELDSLARMAFAINGELPAVAD